MDNKSYRIVFFSKEQCETWEFDETAFATPGEAYKDALEKYPYSAIRIVKLCYPK